MESGHRTAPPTSRAALALCLLVPAPTLGTAAAMFWWPDQPVGQAIFGAAKLWTFALPLLWRAFVDRAPLSWSPVRHGGMAVGAASGLAIALVVWAAYVVANRLGAIEAGMVADRAARTGLDQPGVYLAGALYWITLNSLLEEFVWRWFVFRQFEVIFGARAAVAAAALAFTAHHVVALAGQFDSAITLIASIGVFIGGATWSWLYQRYRSIWPGYVSHAIVDVAVFVIGYRLIFG